MAVLASSLAFVNASLINVALPAMRADLDASPAQLQWMVNAFNLPVAALLLLGGTLGDHHGRRRLLVIGVALFFAGGFLSALLPQFATITAGRAIQGVGAALLLPNSLSLLNGAFAGEARGRAVGTWAAAGAIAGAVAPLAGGAIVDNLGWQLIFWVPLPLALAAIAVALMKVEEVVPDAGGHTDVKGAATATLGLGLIAYTLTSWSLDGVFDRAVILWGGAGLTILALFLWIEHRVGEKAMMPLGLFGARAVLALNLLTFLLYAALGGMLLLLPYLLIESAGYSPTRAGLAIMPFPLLIGLGSPLMGGLAERIGARLPLTIGPLVVAAGLLLGLRIEEGASYWTAVLPSLLTVSAGMAITVAPLTSTVMSAVENRFTGTASGLNNAVSRTGNLVAVALLGGILALSGAALFDGFHRALIVMSVTAAIAGGIASWGLAKRDAR
ncbi:MFS transporter [Sphingomicrobium aestuariivivum]|uniref:MFS transporter n=1 Tax=Sphingomicrobium aestuariivivum TaxID=1582356 RepID=UPI001FD6D0D9|nr:MFS transporter [Sphingomicrobium aestuariivivum]MCJ8191861.1 MFS transporter [Sphingomicrobium aestuariivivum]